LSLYSQKELVVIKAQFGEDYESKLKQYIDGLPTGYFDLGCIGTFPAIDAIVIPKLLMLEVSTRG